MARDRDREEKQRDPKFMAQLGRVSEDMMAFYNKEREAAKARSKRGKGELWEGPGQGDNLIRILPALAPNKPFFKYLGQHWGNFGEKNLPVYCPKLTIAKDMECPMCDFVEEVKAKSNSKKELEYANKIAVRPSWLIQLLDRDEDDDKPKLYFFGATSIYLGIMDLITGRYPDLMSLRDGYDIVLNRVGKTMTDTRYTIAADRDPSEVDEAVLDQMIDLESYVLDRVFDPKDISRVLDDGVDPMDIVKEKEEDSRADADDRPRRKRDRDDDEEKDDDRPARGRSRDRDDDRDRDDAERAPRGRDRDDEPRGRDRDRDRDGDRDRDRERDSERPRGRVKDDEKDDDRDRDRERGRGRDEDDRPRRGRDEDDDRPRGRERDSDDDRGDSRGSSRERAGRDDDRGSRGSKDRDDERPRGRDRDREEEPATARGGRGKYDDEAAAELDRLKNAAKGDKKR